MLDFVVVFFLMFIFFNILLKLDLVFMNMFGIVLIDELFFFGFFVYDVLGSIVFGFKLFLIVSGNIENKFKINFYIGNVFIYLILDREVIVFYILGIRIIDINLLKIVDNVIIVIVVDNNDNLLIFGFMFYEMFIVENIGVGILI